MMQVGYDARAVAYRPATSSCQYVKYGVKRAIDIVGSAAALIFLAPLLVVVALLLVALDPGPVIYSQERVGLGGRKFRIFKFRTMCVNADQMLSDLLLRDSEARLEWMTRQKLVHDPRISWFGRFLRISSIDELPQLFNVLVGDMSLVGPRPIVMDESLRYGRHFQAYCRCRPGLTGLWQVSGRNNTTYQRRVAMDVAYSRAVCFFFDLRILAATVPVVLTAEGSS
jgi:lipopolysaccharide/colanic/teichoic acid biosynthesis glycosyltransferase